jgi:hypothetical protein
MKKYQDQCADIGMLLRDMPPGTTADIMDCSVVYWDGDEITGAHLSPDRPGEVDEPFDVDEVLPEVPETVEAWLSAPSFSFRPSLLEWLKDSPPREAGG